MNLIIKQSIFQRAIWLKWLGVVILLSLSIQPSHAGQPIPEVVYLHPTLLAYSKNNIENGNEDALKRLNDLVRIANRALKSGPYSVVNKTLLPPSGDKHDYMSLGPYWWPDLESPDGLPYIRKDGVINPEALDDSSDQQRKGRMCKDVRSLSLAYYFTGEEQYAKHAALLIRTWFLDPKTSMNPNLQYGQGIRGKNDGRGIGIIESFDYVYVVDAVGLLKPSIHWTARDDARMKAWFHSYLEWLRTHPYGIDESKAHNNHGTYYDIQVVCFALFTQQASVARRVINEVGRKRIQTHIMGDGSQPHELERTKSFHYSCMNLEGLFDLARIGGRLGVDLWKVQVDGKPALRSALDYLIPYANPANNWPYKEMKGVEPDLLLPLISQAYIKYRDNRYLDVLKFFDQSLASSREILVYPLPYSNRSLF